MLILKRKPGEALVIRTPFGPIIIKSLRQERLGIEAPAGMEVLREELCNEGDVDVRVLRGGSRVQTHQH